MDELFQCGEGETKYDVLPWHKRLWYGTIKPTLALPVPKKMLVKDWRLGGIRWLMQASVFAYVTVSMLRSHTYILREVPGVIIQLDVIGNDISVTQNRLWERMKNGEPNFCSDLHEFTFLWERNERVSGCKTMDLSQMYSMSGTELFVTLSTVETEKFSTRVLLPEDRLLAALRSVSNQDSGVGVDILEQICLKEFALNNDTCSFDENRAQGRLRLIPANMLTSALTFTEETEGTLLIDNNSNDTFFHASCECAHENRYFTTGAEDMEIKITSLLFTSFTTNSFPEVRIRKKTKPGEPVKDKMVFPSGAAPQAPISKWLEWMEVDLDKDINSEPNKQWIPSDPMLFESYRDDVLGENATFDFRYPKPRLTGLRVNIKMDFYNNWEAPGLPASRSTGFFVGRTPIICILTLDPSLTWTDTLSRQEIAEDFPLSRTQMIDRRRQGIQFSVETSGELGQFDFGEFTKTVVNALVLLGTVDTFLILFARKGFGEKSRFYDDVLYEKVKLIFDYSRFAVRSLIGSMVFDVIDEDRTGLMNKAELFEYLHKVLFLQNVEPKHTGSLVEFVFDVVEKNLDSDDDLDGPMNPKPKEEGTLKLGHDEDDFKDSDMGMEAQTTNIVQLDGRMHKARKGVNIPVEDELTLNLEDWINIFHGPPCTVDSMVELIQQKNRKGKFLPPKDDSEYQAANKRVLELLEKERKNPPSKANMRAEETKANKTNQKVMKVGRDIERLQMLLKKHNTETQYVLRQVKEVAKEHKTARKKSGGSEAPTATNESGYGMFGF